MNNRDSWGWEVNSESTQEGALANVYDDNPKTYWHSNYGQGHGPANQLPYYFTIDMREVRNVYGFALWSRQDASNSDLKKVTSKPALIMQLGRKSVNGLWIKVRCMNTIMMLPRLKRAIYAFISRNRIESRMPVSVKSTCLVTNFVFAYFK